MKFSWVDLLCVVCKDVCDCPLRNILKKKKKSLFNSYPKNDYISRTNFQESGGLQSFSFPVSKILERGCLLEYPSVLAFCSTQTHARSLSTHN